MSVDVVAENARVDGVDTFANLNTSGNGDIHAQGFARRPSYNVGETAQFSVDGASTVIDIYRVGWYGGSGFRKVATVANTPATQPEAEVIPNSNGATTCTGWSVTANWVIPSDAVSGLYLAMVRSVAPYAPNAFYITFVVRDDAAQADILYKTSDATWGAAYNYYGTKAVPKGGKNVYGQATGVGQITQRSFAVSYHRPVITRDGVAQTFWMACEMPMIRWLEKNGYTVKYTTCVDIDKSGLTQLSKAKIFLSSGHDEYWSKSMRDAVETWRDSGAHHSIFMSGNEVFWKTRYVYTGDEATMWCYKDTMPGPDTHVAGVPLDPVDWTGTWKDTRWPGRRPEWLLTGTDFGMNGVYDYAAEIPVNPYGGYRQWGLTSLVDAPVTLISVMGFEADHVHPTQPDGSYKILAAYTRSAPGGLSDENGQNYNVAGNVQWGIVSQRYLSGAITVGFGTCQWAWSLDTTHDRGEFVPVSVASKQFTQNILRDLGAAPGTMEAGLQAQTPGSLDNYGVVPDGTWVPPDPIDPEDPDPTPEGDPLVLGLDGYLGDGRSVAIVTYTGQELDVKYI